MAMNEILPTLLASTMIGSLLAIGLAIFLVIIIVVYVYNALAWMTIATKLKYKYPWLAWIPFANWAMTLQLGGFHWAWIFLIFLPILGWIALFVLGIIATWRVFEKRKYPGWLSLIQLINMAPGFGFFASIGYLIILGIVAWKDQK